MRRIFPPPPKVEIIQLDDDEMDGNSTPVQMPKFPLFSMFSPLLEIIPEEPICDYTLRNPLLFGDYRNAVNESEPRFYEDLLDYEAILFLFQEVGSQQ